MAVTRKTEKKPKIHYDMKFELIVIGDSGVGKTCILLRYADDMFKMTFISTIGMDFKVKTIELDGKIIKLQIWDTAGQERFRTITSSYYRGAMGIMLVFDVTDQKSFDNVTNWMKNIEKHASVDVERILVGNKCDLESKRVIPRNKAEQMAESHNVRYIETSAKINHNIDKAFEILTRQIVDKSGNKMLSRRQEDVIDLKQKEDSNKCSC